MSTRSLFVKSLVHAAESEGWIGLYRSWAFIIPQKKLEKEAKQIHKFIYVKSQLFVLALSGPNDFVSPDCSDLPGSRRQPSRTAGRAAAPPARGQRQEPEDRRGPHA